MHIEHPTSTLPFFFTAFKNAPRKCRSGDKIPNEDFFATGILHLAKNQGLVEVQWYFKSFLQNLKNNCRL